MTTRRRVALTFDDGPGPSTEALLDVLASHRARATFFLLGRNLQGEALGGDEERARAIAGRAAREGHLLGNHTMTHAPALQEEELLREIESCDRLVRESYARGGQPVPSAIPIRLPFGPFRSDGPRSLATLERIGRPHCHWSGDPRDWQPGSRASEIAAQMLVHIGEAWRNDQTPVLLFHDAGQGDSCGDAAFGVVRTATVQAVNELCATLAPARPQYLDVLACEGPTLRFQAL
jgi:peptidoglycan/xylan/chitin deacetylase (PgdA/CDA1 family)